MAIFLKTKLGEVAKIVSGGTPSSANLNYWENGNIFWATLPDLKNKYLYKTERMITEAGLKKSSAKLLPLNTVIFSSRATIGEVAITKVITSTNQGSKNFICNLEKVDPEFLYYSLKYNSKSIEQLASGATYKEINKTDLLNVEIELPLLSIQHGITSVLSGYDDLIE
ncbi:MAG: restriction endonuclease subunit S, partial [Bacteroidales bacterium]|nr:restriction endonuclease subunit S [Bacteroidales bacterium]